MVTGPSYAFVPVRLVKSNEKKYRANRFFESLIDGNLITTGYLFHKWEMENANALTDGISLSHRPTKLWIQVGAGFRNVADLSVEEMSFYN